MSQVRVGDLAIAKSRRCGDVLVHVIGEGDPHSVTGEPCWWIVLMEPCSVQNSSTRKIHTRPAGAKARWRKKHVRPLADGQNSVTTTKEKELTT